MKNIYTLMLVLLATAFSTALAQNGDSWKIILNKKMLLQTPVASDRAVVMIDKKMTLAKNIISITYKSADSESDFKRKFFINDEQENTIKRVELTSVDGTVSFNMKDLKAMAAAKKPLFIYTTAVPKDPALAAAVRVRRLLLCKIEWK